MMEVRSLPNPRPSSSSTTTTAGGRGGGWSIDSPHIQSVQDRAVKLPTLPSSVPTSFYSRTRSFNNMTDFEDVGLEEDISIGGRMRNGSITNNHNSINGRRPQLRPITTSLAIPPSAVGNTKKPTRELVAQRPSLSTIHSTPVIGNNASTTNDPKNNNNFLRLPVKTSRSKRSSKSPTRVASSDKSSSSGSSNTPTSSSPRSTTPTPVSPRPRSEFVPPRSRTATSPVPQQRTTGLRTPTRVQSWQHSQPRKTVEEMEKECDDDSGDEVPDNTVFWNVPLSPRAGRILQSNSPSPERLSQPMETRRASIANVNVNNSPSNSPIKQSASTTSLPTSISSSETPEYINRGRLRNRGKSWGDVIQELGDETKDLTEALERHADHILEMQEQRLQKNVRFPGRRNSSPAKGNTIALPPKQVINATIDPLPISKEKEAAMSRTRPTWLPPKSKEEERKHLKQYQDMMRLSLEAGTSTTRPFSTHKSMKEFHNAFSFFLQKLIIYSRT